MVPSQEKCGKKCSKPAQCMANSVLARLPEKDVRCCQLAKKIKSKWPKNKEKNHMLG